MRTLLLLFTATAVGACSAPAGMAPAFQAQVPAAAAPAATGAPAGSTGQPPAAPAGGVSAPGTVAPTATAPAEAEAPTVSGVVTAPETFRAIGEPQARYLLGLKGKQRPMANTEITLTDAQGNSLGIKGVTDAQGRYSLRITIELEGRPIVVNARVLDGAGKPVTLRTIARAQKKGELSRLHIAADIDFASTVVAQHALMDGGLTDFSPETYAKLVARVEDALDGERVWSFNLADARDVLRELSRLVKRDPSLQTDFQGFNEGNPLDYSPPDGDGHRTDATSNEPEIILTGQVM